MTNDFTPGLKEKVEGFFVWLETTHPKIRLTPKQRTPFSLLMLGCGWGKEFRERLLREYAESLGLAPKIPSVN